MKTIKKALAALLAAAAIITAASCSNNYDVSNDSKYIKDKGELVVGITEFAPMDYQQNGEWVGFDADMAKKFAESLGVKATFKVIEWDYKVNELNDKGIDCVWNGMTINDAVTTAMEVSNAYCNNKQVVVVKAADADKYKTLESIKDLQFVVESGSAGMETAKDNGFKFIEAGSQADTLLEVSSGTSQASIIDLLMAGAMLGEGTDYKDLAYTVSLTEEKYGVGFRKGSDLAAKLNEFFKTSYADGTMKEIAQKYNVSDTIIAQ